MTFRVGQKVVCVDDGNFSVDRHPWVSNKYLPNRPVRGNVYTVRGFDPDFPESIYLCEIYNPNDLQWANGFGEGSFLPRRFRPIVERKTDISFAHEILKKASNKQGADA